MRPRFNIGGINVHFSGEKSLTTVYRCGRSNGASGTSAAVVANTLYATRLLYVPQFPCKIVTIGFNPTATGGVGTTAKIALYKGKGYGTMYPGARLAVSGALATTGSANRTYSVDVTIDPNEDYWLAYVGNGTPDLRCDVVGNTSHILGQRVMALNAQSYLLSGAFTYADPPDPFPAGLTYAEAVPIPSLYITFGSL